MDIPLFPSNQIPRPPNEIQIEAIHIMPYSDRFRVRVHVKVTAFLERPNVLIVARNKDNTIVSELNIIETMHNDMEFTLHIRNMKEPAGEYTLEVDLFYKSRTPPQDRKMETFIIPEASSATGG